MLNLLRRTSDWWNSAPLVDLAQDLRLAARVLRRRIAFTATVVATLVLTRYLASLLFGVPPTDASTITAAFMVTIAIALAASYMPARLAARIDPVIRCARNSRNTVELSERARPLCMSRSSVMSCTVRLTALEPRPHLLERQRPVARFADVCVARP